MVWRLDKVRFEIVPYTRGIVLDMGCGPRKAFPHFLGVDSCKDTELFGIEIKPDVTCDVSDPAAIEHNFHRESVDAVFSSHCLEHIEDFRAALAAWWSLIKVGGHLVLYLPHRDLYPNVGTEGANPDHKHDFGQHDILTAMGAVALASETGFDQIVDEKRDDGMEYSFLQVYRKTSHAEWNDLETYTSAKPRPAKTACVVRYGGFGDMIQAANLFPALKREGFHVTVMTTPKGQDILAHDPHIDEWFIQDADQVPNHELADFWRVQATKFDRFINLSESIEGTLLALPGRANHSWPVNLRRRELNRNYLEWTAQIAEVPYSSEARFYASIEEAAQARRYLAHVEARMAKLPKPAKPNAAQRIMGTKPASFETGPRPVFHVMWALAGSSVHKFTPWQDHIIAKMLLTLPDVAITLTGDAACQILEAGWEEEPRVFRQSGEMSIRQTLALAQASHLVIGPETGVLNAVAFEDNWKVVFLSHSSRENLTKHWTNTVTLEPDAKVAPCWPCHRLHYGRDYCPEDKETGAAMCQVSITPERAWEGIKQAYAAWKASLVREEVCA
jgi:ADP-heptose:LPS heptosyltransferase/predicted SAM-dependent methyltransferase